MLLAGACEVTESSCVTSLHQLNVFLLTEYYSKKKYIFKRNRCYVALSLIFLQKFKLFEVSLRKAS